MAPSDSEMTPGQRLYLIRLACGDGVREPETQEDFVARVKRRTKQAYSAMTLSNLERMKQRWKLEDVEAFAAVDPLNRGVGWLGFGLPPEAIPEDDAPAASRSKKA